MTTKKPAKAGPKGSAEPRKAKRDRHGRAVDIAETATDLLFEIKFAGRLRAIARQVFLDRNAQGYPERNRAAITKATREHHRRALHHAGKARDAILNQQGDQAFQIEWLQACLALQTAQTAIRQAYIDQYRKNQSDRTSGNVGPRRTMAAADDGDDAPEYDFSSMKDIVRSLAGRRDALGDLLPSNELWPEVYAILDDMGLGPKEVGEKENREYHHEGGKPLKFASFKSTLSRVRAERGLT